MEAKDLLLLYTKFQEFLTGKVPVNKELLRATVPVSEDLLTGPVNVNNLFLKDNVHSVRPCRPNVNHIHLSHKTEVESVQLGKVLSLASNSLSL